MVSDDPLWPRASAWLAAADADRPDLAIVGVPTAVASISGSDGHRTPRELRRVLSGFSPFDGEWGSDLTELRVADLGDWDVAELDMTGSQERIFQLASQLDSGPVHVFVGGDNAITRPLVKALAPDLDRIGVLTLDAHHDVRSLDEGPSNGTPIRGLIEDGLSGDRVIQVGIHSFANSLPYRRYCAEQGIRIVTMETVEADGIERVIDAALGDLAAACDAVYVDFDIDVLDRAFAPGCPGSRPGGMTPRQLAAAARRCGAHPAVVACDLVEVDPARDVGDLTLQSTATVFLAFAAGVARRLGSA